MSDLNISDELKAEFDQKLERLQAHKKKWATLPLRKKVSMLRRLAEKTHGTAQRQVDAAVSAKGIDPNSPQVGEEWLGGPIIVLRNLRLLIDSLEQVANGRKPELPNPPIVRDGQVVANVFPMNGFDKLMYQGFEAEVWMEPGVGKADVASTQAVFYDEDDPDGALALVLGAGNVASIGPLDVVYKLFVEGQVCILKMNPVNDYLGEFIEEAFSEFIDGGYLEMAYGGAGVGAYLCSHEMVDEIHITGSDRTHDAIVYGVGPEAEKRKENDERLITKRITSELGNVSPIVIVPGKWSKDDIAFHAANLATQLANNGGFNCNAARVIITHAAWPQREEFFEELGRTLERAPKRVAYYPGAEDRWSEFCGQNENHCEMFGTKSGEVLPWTVIRDVSPNDEDNIVFNTEAFAGVMAETALEAADTSDFIKVATAFCNDKVWGTLNAEIIVHPDTAATYHDEIEQAIADLEYGSIGINHWPALSYALGATTWGAFPGHTFQDIQSGIGVVHNTFMFDQPQKSVVRGPFRIKPTPPWFVTNKNTHNIAPKLADFELQPSAFKFAGIALSSLRG